jgi:hypothetical protein
MLSFLIARTSAAKWKLDQTLKLDQDLYNIYGRALSISTTEPKRLVISASWEGYDPNAEGTIDSKTGAAKGVAYVYQYSSEKGEYVFKQRIEPTDSNDVKIKNFGSTIRISADGKRIVGGAPYSDVKSSAETFLTEAGAIVVFDYNEETSQFEQKAVLHVENPTKEQDEGQGLGRSLTTTPDCKVIASAYYNKPKMVKFIHDHGVVFVTEEKGGQFSNFKNEARIEPSTVYDGYSKDDFFKFGSSLTFVDAQHLLVSSYLFTNKDVEGAVPNTKYGTAFLKKDGDRWVKDSVIGVPPAPSDDAYEEYGSPVSMPFDNQKVMATYGMHKSKKTMFYINEFNGTVWNNVQTIEASSSTGAVFCNANVFFTDAGSEYNEDNTMYKSKIGIYRRNSEGKYILSETIESEQIPEANDFGSDMQWGDDCKSIYVGSMAKNDTSKTGGSKHTPQLGSRAYIYRLTEERKNNSDDDDTVVIIVCSVLGACLIAGVIIGVILYVRKNKREETDDTYNQA